MPDSTRHSTLFFFWYGACSPQDITRYANVAILPSPSFFQVMTASRVGVTAGLCDLITGMTSGAGCATLGPNLAIELEKLFVYSLIWSVGGLLEFEDR